LYTGLYDATICVSNDLFVVHCFFQFAVMLNSDCILPGTCNHWHTILYRNIDQKLVNSLHGLLNCETGGLDCRVITRENRTRVDCIHL